jgi:hypothetical protein
MRSDYTYWLNIQIDVDAGKVDDVEAVESMTTSTAGSTRRSRAVTLPKNLIRHVSRQHLEGDGVRRPALPIADACQRSRWRELWWRRSFEQRRKPNLCRDEFDIGCQAPYTGQCLRTDKDPRSNLFDIHESIDSRSVNGSDPYRDRIGL